MQDREQIFGHYLVIIATKNDLKRLADTRGKMEKNRITMRVSAIWWKMQKRRFRSTNQKVGGSKPFWHTSKKPLTMRVKGFLLYILGTLNCRLELSFLRDVSMPFSLVDRLIVQMLPRIRLWTAICQWFLFPAQWAVPILFRLNKKSVHSWTLIRITTCAPWGATLWMASTVSISGYR